MSKKIQFILVIYRPETSKLELAKGPGKLIGYHWERLDHRMLKVMQNSLFKKSRDYVRNL